MYSSSAMRVEAAFADVATGDVGWLWLDVYVSRAGAVEAK